jgi:putative restriction endonuclease
MSERAEELLQKLPMRHQEALRWFLVNRDTIQPWPTPMRDADGQTFLAARPKGIYKPKWSQYALSVRQTLSSPYPDRDPVYRPDGSWRFSYFQERIDPADRDGEFTNRAMVACWRDNVPVGVMRQIKPNPGSRYQILGIAIVANWDGGYFFLEGFGTNGEARSRGPAGELEWLILAQEQAQLRSGSFDPTGIIDARERTLSQIVRRRGQPQFRQQLLDAYESRCAISNFNAVEALEAAHITPFLGAETNRPDNGLLLRADLHTLFDLGLIAIDPARMSVLVSPGIARTDYGELAGASLRLPRAAAARPSVAALQAHLDWSGL